MTSDSPTPPLQHDAANRQKRPARICAADAPVAVCSPICRDHVRVEVILPDFPASTPGQFLELLCADSSAQQPNLLEWPARGYPKLSGIEWSVRSPYLRRPFSIADAWIDSAARTHLVVISRAVGMGTRWLERLRPGETLNLSGPLGVGFRLPPPDVPVVLVGGGVGIPPLLYAARVLTQRGSTDVTAIFGALTRELMPIALRSEPASDGAATPCIVLPAEAPFSAILTTDDGTLGMRGFVTTGLAAWHARNGSTAARALVLACGPDPMLRAVARQTRALGIEAQLCIEKLMGCGMGTCLSCVTRVRAADRPAGWRWALSCTEGPVFDRDVLLEYADA